jgi:hypothetical protein
MTDFYLIQRMPYTGRTRIIVKLSVPAYPRQAVGRDPAYPAIGGTGARSGQMRD